LLELAALAEKEQDPKKLIALVTEINRLLADDSDIPTVQLTRDQA
jgi:hypothetical protein